MSVPLTKLLLESPAAKALDALAFNVMRAITWRAQDDGWCSGMTLAQLEHETHFERRAIRRGIRQSQDAGVLLAEERPGSRTGLRFRVLEAGLRGGESPAGLGTPNDPSRTPKSRVRKTFTPDRGAGVNRVRLLFTPDRQVATPDRGSGVHDLLVVRTDKIHKIQRTAEPRARSLEAFDRRAATWLRFLHETLEAKPEDFYDPYRALGDRYNRVGLETALRELAAKDGFSGPRIDQAVAARVRQFIAARSQREMDAAAQEARDRRRSFDRAKRNGFRDAAPSMRAQLAAGPPPEPCDDPEAQQPGESFTAWRHRLSGRDGAAVAR